MFGTPALTDILELKTNYSKEEIKKICGFKTNKIIVSCGYNGGIAQQHLKILEALNTMSCKYKDSIILYLHMGYGLTSNYYNIIKEKIEKIGIEYKIDTNFYNDSEIAKIIYVRCVYTWANHRRFIK